VVIDPRAVGDRHPDPAVRALVRLAVGVTEHPWAMTGVDLAHFRAAGLADTAILHAVLQSCLFGHFNRIADAVGVDLDYPDTFGAPHIEPATPAYLWPDTVPDQATPRPVDIANWPAALDLATAWEQYALERDSPLTRHQRMVVAAAVAQRLGDATRQPVAPESDLEAALVDLADVVTLAPWRLGPDAYAKVRDLGLPDDADVFDAVATASSAGVLSRMRVSLAALARP
jgi:alkylhydroperoxidase family enzyme